MQRDQTLAPEINPQNFPYRLKWTQELVDEVLERWERLKHTMTDVVGPSGQRFYVDPSYVAILALHCALAGGDINDDIALIEFRLRPTEYNLFEHIHEWRAKGEFPEDDPPITPEEINRRAEAVRQEMRDQVEPEVLSALQAKLAREYLDEQKKTRKRGKRVTKEGE